ncbi:MAG TPA: hypothetical protein VG273_16520 [Bryobacteraceae bacterium]|nr:hypothetical protein [Bryobacteraceae bacterium]
MSRFLRAIAILVAAAASLAAQCPQGYSPQNGSCLQASTPLYVPQVPGSVVVSFFGNSASAAVNLFGGNATAGCSSGAAAGSYWPTEGYFRSATLTTSATNGKSAMRGNIDVDCSGNVNGSNGPSPGGVIVPPLASAGGFTSATDFYHVSPGSQSAFGWTVGNGSATAANVVAGAVEFVDAAGQAATILPMVGMTVTASTTKYGGPFGNCCGGGGELGQSMPFPIAGTISSLVACSDGTSPTNSETLTVDVSASPSSLTVTLPGGSAGRGCYVDSTHSIAVTAGQYLTWSATAGSGTVSNFVWVAVKFVPASGTSTIVGGSAYTAPTTTVNYSTVGSTADTNTLANAEVAMPISCLAANLYVTLTGSSATADIFTLYKNGVATALTGSLVSVSGAQAVDTTHTVSFAKGDLVTLAKSTASGTGAIPGGFAFSCN